ncbi:hypothetical protein ACFFWB_15030 [Flavobacterium procerum]|uniref:hypothetical protein n=1 Tax=Flavobacterium procerum TaxID=1455569 RepID=UPI0035EFE0B4
MNQELNELFEIKKPNSNNTDTKIFDVMIHIAARILIPSIIFFLLYLIGEFVKMGLEGLLILIFFFNFYPISN